MVEPVDAAGLPTKLEPGDYLMFRGEGNPRTRSAGMGVNLLDTTPDWDAFRAHLAETSRRVPRLRQKVVVPALPTAAPRWVDDPDFDLDFHVRRVRVPGPATLREVFDLAEVLLQSPIDTARPLWTVTLVEGLAEGRAAMLLHMSHSLVDGVGGVELFAQLYGLERVPLAKRPVPRDMSPDDQLRRGTKQLRGAVLEGLWGAWSMVSRVVLQLPSALTRAIGYARSGARTLSRAAQPSPLLRQRSVASRTEALEIRLSDLHKAAKAGGGSINDAYLAGLCGALGRYHRALGAPIETLSMVVPVSLRTEDDPAAGNRITVVGLSAPVGEADPVDRMRKIRAQMKQRREEPARDILAFVRPVLSVLPAALLEAVTRPVAPWDVIASNVPSYPGDAHVAGAKVLRQYGFGALPGVAMVVNLLSTGEWCTVTVRYNRAAVQDPELFSDCLLKAYDEVLALGGEPVPRVMPASSVWISDVRAAG
ncbi:wax ester/triacylglycerol synthase family O-acyltransferase [Mycobacterium sp. 94-17]|uniref:wax ester/triacylglycerol synthase family O-acyltransferase n=1 Tax=Mycobacterium sp. 94-17 TaxID=2986147 RepID=UPI002D1EFB1E|nr:wax ester/triacylglycerol synthase family O-acyltransferase [Mycobacterium sp. 94-17]MEB4209661.1 wax ester/triacylglycerol synthase family O-acyltransferase [Mycobacterium sp. 94-17]